VAEKVAEEEPAATVIEDGTVTRTLLLTSVTAVSPEGAAWLKVTVQSVLAPGLMMLGLQARENGTIPVSKLMATCRVAPPTVAVSVATCDSGIRPAVALNVAAVRLAQTVTEGISACNRLLLLANPTTVPPEGEGLLNVIMQLVTAPACRLVGLHASDDSVSGWGATRLMVAVCDAPFRLAVKVAL
jgi:hypothetical protein